MHSNKICLIEKCEDPLSVSSTQKSDKILYLFTYRDEIKLLELQNQKNLSLNQGLNFKTYNLNATPLDLIYDEKRQLHFVFTVQNLSLAKTTSNNQKYSMEALSISMSNKKKYQTYEFDDRYKITS